MKINKTLWVLTASLSVLFSCNDDDDINKELQVPATYTFTRNGGSSVSYSGQTDRLDMLAELKSYLASANTGAELSTLKLLDMYGNENAPFEDAALNESTKQLEDKTYSTDIEFYKNLFVSAEAASKSGVATEGTAGLMTRGTGNILVNEKGWEYTQVIEKGLMGAVFLNQIYNTYLTDSKIGADVENDNLEDGKNYTAMEHHWDEAFGYWGMNPEFDTEGEARFWSNYALGREELVGSFTALKNAYLAGRTAIVNKNYPLLAEQRNILYEQFELLAAAATIHYLNEVATDTNEGDRMHHASEGYGFARALAYSPNKKISEAQLQTLLGNAFGTDADFYKISNESLTQGKDLLKTVYPTLADIADDL